MYAYDTILNTENQVEMINWCFSSNIFIGDLFSICFLSDIYKLGVIVHHHITAYGCMPTP